MQCKPTKFKGELYVRMIKDSVRITYFMRAHPSSHTGFCSWRSCTIKAFEMPRSGWSIIADWCCGREHCRQKKVKSASAKPLIPDVSWTKAGWKQAQREPRGAEKLRRQGPGLSYTHSHFINTLSAPLHCSLRANGQNSTLTKWNGVIHKQREKRKARKRKKLCRVLEKPKSWA